MGIPPDFAGGRATVVAAGVVALPPIDEPTGGFPALDSATDPFPAHLGDLMDEAEPFRSQRTPLPPPAWVLPEDTEGTALPELSAAGAFGGGPPESGRRFGPAAFDPGRRGVKALAAVAIVVIVIAAVLAWRARPRVDPVAPPAFDATATDARQPSPGGAAVVQLGSRRAWWSRSAARSASPAWSGCRPGARVADALTAAGGAAAGRRRGAAQPGPQGGRRRADHGRCHAAAGRHAGARPAGRRRRRPAGGPVNLNTATLAELDTLPGVGPVLAQRILDARDAQGGFNAVSDLRKVDGIGDARYEQLKDLVTV